jgi:putative SOS response-associated peptidase YedK
MNSFVGQDGTIKFHYDTYGVDEVSPYEPRLRVRPNALLNLVAVGPRGLEQHRGNWGMGTGRFDWNARDDRLATSPLWKSMWKHPGQHVVVPASRVYESTTRDGARQWHAVRRRDDAPLWIAGLGRVQKGAYRVEWHVALATVDAGPVFHEIHDRPREVACLRDWKEVGTWLDAKDEAALRALLRPAGPDFIESYRVHDDVLKETFPADRCAEPV